MRDLSEIRAGVNSYDFQHTKYPPDNPHYCLCLIGSERTISLEMPSKVIVSSASLRCSGSCCDSSAASGNDLPF